MASDLVAFLQDVRYIILFFVLGDFFTTRHALNYGFEENGFLRIVMAEYGIWSLLVLKMLFLVIVYCNYRLLREEGAGWMRLWGFSKGFIVSTGIFLVLNNLMAIFMECSIIRAIQSILL